MDVPSEERLLEAADRFNLELRDGELSELRSLVASNLRKVETVAEVPISGGDADTASRSWTRVEPNGRYEHNEVITECQIPPPDESGPLAGVDVGLKDNIAVADVPMTCASDAFAGYRPATDATVVERLRDAGATIVAKTNLDEFGNAGLGTNALGSPIRNPFDATRTAGGSSGGSAAAVASGIVDAALGTDTGGSVRIPAAYCGVVGVKPSFGLVSRFGVVENTHALDHVGPIAPSVETATSVLEAIEGVDPKDPATVQASGRAADDDNVDGGFVEGCFVEGDFVVAVEDPPSLADVTVGVVEESLADGQRQEVLDRTRTAIEHIESAGAAVRDVSVPHYRLGNPVKNALSDPANAAVWRSGGLPYRGGGYVDPVGDYRTEWTHRLRTAGRELNAEMKAKILAGALLIEDADGRHFVQAQTGRELLRSEFVDAFDAVDVLLTPTMPDVAPPLDECPPDYDYGRHVRHANLLHAPAITIPNSEVDGLPVGLQLMGTPYDDAAVLGIAAAVEEVLA